MLNWMHLIHIKNSSNNLPFFHNKLSTLSLMTIDHKNKALKGDFLILQMLCNAFHVLEVSWLRYAQTHLLDYCNHENISLIIVFAPIIHLRKCEHKEFLICYWFSSNCCIYLPLNKHLHNTLLFKKLEDPNFIG